MGQPAWYFCRPGRPTFGQPLRLAALALLLIKLLFFLEEATKTVATKLFFLVQICTTIACRLRP